MTNCYLSVVIPAWNEEKRLPRTLERCIEFLDSKQYTSEIIVVTDGSTDATEPVARSYAARFPSLRVLSFPSNRGKGFAVKEGMLAAEGKYRLFMDADYAVPIDCLESFLGKIAEGYSIVLGSRAHPQAQILCPQEFPRRQLALGFGWLQEQILKLPFRDTQCGFKMFTAEAAMQYFPRLHYECAYFDTELIYLCYHSGALLAELPVTWTHDQQTRLPIGLKRSLELFQKLLQIPKLHSNSVQEGLAQT